MSNKFTGYLFILLAATLWGTLGVFYKFIASSYLLSSLEIVFWRAFFASLFTFSFTEYGVDKISPFHGKISVNSSPSGL